jgi:hypothetical protein
MELKLATLEGLEPSAYCLEGSCSIQLSYKVNKLVGVEGIEPTQGGHLPQRDYKSLSQSNAHSVKQVRKVGLEPTTNGLKGRYSDH